MVQLKEDAFLILLVGVVLDRLGFFVRRVVIVALVAREEADHSGENLLLGRTGVLFLFVLGVGVGLRLGTDDVREHGGVFGADVFLVFVGDDLGEASRFDVDGVALLLGTVNRDTRDDLVLRACRLALLNGRLLLFGGGRFGRFGFLGLFRLLRLFGGLLRFGHVDIDARKALNHRLLAERVSGAEYLSREFGALGIFGCEGDDLIRLLRLRRILCIGRRRFLRRFGIFLRLLGGVHLLCAAVHQQLRLNRGGGFFADDRVSVVLFLLFLVQFKGVGIGQTRLFVRVAENFR